MGIEISQAGYGDPDKLADLLAERLMPETISIRIVKNSCAGYS